MMIRFFFVLSDSAPLRLLQTHNIRLRCQYKISLPELGLMGHIPVNSRPSDRKPFC